jgi:hypothetical protein
MSLYHIQDTLIRVFEQRRSTVVAIVVSLSVLFLSLVLGYRVSKLPLMLLGVVLGGLVLTIICLKDMITGITLLITTSATINFTIGTGSATPLPLGMLFLAFLVGIWILRMAMIERRIELMPSSVNLPFLVFIVSTTISWIVGYVIWDWKVEGKSNLFFVQAGQYAIFVLSVTATLLVSNHPLKERDMKRWTAILVGIGIANYMFLAFVRYDGLFRSFTGSLLMWPILLIWAQLMFNPGLKPWMRIGALGISLVWLYWVYTKTFVWKGGWVPALLGLLFLLWFRARRVFIIVSIILALTGFVSLGWLKQNILSAEVRSGSSIRPLYWYDVIRMTSRSPLFGLGPANYEYYWSDPNFVPLSRIASGWDTWNDWGYSPPSHNTVIDIYAQTGALGLLFIVWGVTVALWLCYRIAATSPPGFRKAYSYAVLCGFISLAISSFLFADWLIPYVYNITITGFRHTVYSWLLLGSVLGLANSSKDKEHG